MTPLEITTSNLQGLGMTATIEVLKCPACGGLIGLKDRRCSYCRAVLLITGIDPHIDAGIEAGLISKAASKWRTRLQEAPEDPEANHALGLLYYNQNLHAEAIPLFRAAAKLAPEIARYHYNLALSLFQNGELRIPSADYDELVIALRKASQIDPDFGEAPAFRHFFLGLKLENIDPQEQIVEYQKAIDRCQDIPIFFSNLGLALFQAKDFHKSEAALKRAISLSPHLFVPHHNLSTLYLTTKNFSEGLTEAGESLKYALTDQHQAMAYVNRGVALSGLKNFKEAVANLKRGVVLDPGEPLYAKELEAAQFKLSPWSTWFGAFCGLLAILLLIWWHFIR